MLLVTSVVISDIDVEGVFSKHADCTNDKILYGWRQVRNCHQHVIGFSHIAVKKNNVPSVGPTSFDRLC